MTASVPYRLNIVTSCRTVTVDISVSAACSACACTRRLGAAGAMTAAVDAARLFCLDCGLVIALAGLSS